MTRALLIACVVLLASKIAAFGQAYIDQNLVAAARKALAAEVSTNAVAKALEKGLWNSLIPMTRCLSPALCSQQPPAFVRNDSQSPLAYGLKMFVAARSAVLGQSTGNGSYSNTTREYISSLGTVTSIPSEVLVSGRSMFSGCWRALVIPGIRQ